MKFRENLKYPIKSWSKIIKGHPAFILGNGPSLLENDLSLLTEYFTIGINRIYQVFDPIILLWQDKGLYQDGISHLENCSAIKCCRSTIDKHNKWTHFEVKGNPYKFHYDPANLWGFGCSGALGVQMAVAMGATSVVLLGMDCDYETPEKTDFYGRNKDHRPHTVRNFHKAAKWIKLDCPVPVYNCGRSKYWPRRDLEEVIREIGPIKKTRLQWLTLLSIKSDTNFEYNATDDRMGNCPV